MQQSKVYGLELSTDQARLVGLSRKGAEWRASVSANIPLPPNTFGPDGIQNPDTLRAIVTELRKNLGDDKDKPMVNVALPQGLLVFRRYSMPALKPQEVQRTLRLQASQFLPIPKDEACADFAVVDLPDQDEKTQVLVAGSTHETVNTLIQILKESGFQIGAITPSAVALGRVTTLWEVEAPRARRGLLVVDGEEIRAYAFQGTTPLGARTLLATINDGQSAYTEIRHSLEVEQIMPDKVWVLGDAPRDWIENLGKMLNVPVTRAPKLAKGLNSRFAIAAGLALVSSSDAKTLNLARARLFRLKTSPWRRPMYVMGAAALILLLYLPYWGIQLRSARRALATAERTIADASQITLPSTEPLQGAEDALAQIRSSSVWSKILSDVTAKAPAGVSVGQITSTGESQPQPGQPAHGITLQVVSTAQTLEQAEQFAAALRSIPYFKFVDITMVQQPQGPSSSLSFHVNIQLAQGDRKL